MFDVDVRGFQPHRLGDEQVRQADHGQAYRGRLFRRLLPVGPQAFDPRLIGKLLQEVEDGGVGAVAGGDQLLDGIGQAVGRHGAATGDRRDLVERHGVERVGHQQDERLAVEPGGHQRVPLAQALRHESEGHLIQGVPRGLLEAEAVVALKDPG
ncbi:MAG: hypothetical protein FD126_3146 [Elusimicrobia bacterium]|nr:MAG: hypothetical protein FD126_3146 [Elusimicrobiota bacterium]